MKGKLLILLAWFLCGSLSAQSVPERLRAYVHSAAILQTSEAGITVFDLTSGKQMYRYRDKKLCRPASVEKVITSVTALALLGEEHVFRTRLAYDGQVTPDSVLQGDLYVVGGLDPEFMDADMDRLADAVLAAGIRRMEGRLVADISLTDSVHWGAGWSWDDAPEAFQPYLSPLMLNRGCVDVTVWPAARGMKPAVEVSPRSDYYAVDNRAESRSPRCGKLEITRDWQRNGNTIRITGNVAGRSTRTLSLYSSEGFFLQTLCHRLGERGVFPSSTAYGVCPAGASEIFSVSRPLFPVLKRALKRSDNLSAEALFLHLGVQEADTLYAGFRDAQRAVYRFMRQKIGRLPGNYQIVDGSGVSLYNYVSPDLILEYLKYAYYHAGIFQPFYDALPVAGVDGTLHYRMKSGKAFRNVRAKTGTVAGISSLAGYVRAANGHLLAFVIVNQNILEGARARAFQDKICEILAQ